MTRDDLVKQYGNLSSAAKALGMPRNTLASKLKRGEKVEPRAPSAGKSIEDFRAAHDKSWIVPRKIRDALKALGSGWEYEVNFLKLAGLSTTDLANFRDQFAEHIVLVDRVKRVWAGTKETAAKLREMV